MDGTGDQEGHEGHGQGRGGDEYIQGLLASGKFSRMPPPPPGSRSLTCSRLVDENNQLKALPEELLRGPNQLLEEIETDESIVACCTQDIGSGRARHSLRPRGQRMARKLRNGIQGVEKGNQRRGKTPGAQRKNASGRQSIKDATSGKMEEFEHETSAGSILEVMNKSNSRTMVLKVVGHDDWTKQTLKLRPGEKLKVEGEMAIWLRKMDQRCEVLGSTFKDSARKPSLREQSSAGIYQRKQPIVQTELASVSVGPYCGHVRHSSNSHSVGFEVSSTPESMIEEEDKVARDVAGLRFDPIDDQSDICVEENLGRAMQFFPVNDGIGNDEKLEMEPKKRKSEEMVKSKEHGVEDTADEVMELSCSISKKATCVEAGESIGVQNSIKTKEGNLGERKHKVGRGRHRVAPLKSKVGSGTWGKQSSWVWEFSKVRSRKDEVEKTFSARIKTLRCSTPMCGQFIKPNDLGEVTRMCRNCIEDQLKIFEMFGKRVKGAAEISSEVKQSKRELSVSSGNGKTLETTPALMLPPSGGVKRANRERRVASVRGSLSVIRSLTSSRAGSAKPRNSVHKKTNKKTETIIGPESTVLQLKQECKKAGLPQRGVKAALLARLGWKKPEGGDKVLNSNL